MCMGSIAGGQGQSYGWMWVVTRLSRAVIFMRAFTRTLVHAFARLLVCCIYICTLVRMCICMLAGMCICTLADFLHLQTRLLVWHLIALSCPHLHFSLASFYTFKTSSHFSFTSWGKTRPDTRPIPVADEWAGAEIRVFALSNLIITNGPTDQQTNRQTKLPIESLVRD